MRYGTLTLLASLTMTWAGRAAEPPSPERGKQALLTRAYTPATWTAAGYESAWKYWDGQPEKPAGDYDAALREYYGLHPAPYENGRLPMGLREGAAIFGGKGVATDCLLCHGGSILGKSYIGLGNAALEIQALFEDLGKASKGPGKTPFIFSRMRGTSEAGAMAVFLLSYREPDLKIRLVPQDLGLRDDLIEDVPAWWHLKKKKTMYHTGGTDARSVRSLMQFMLSPLNSAAVFTRDEVAFRDIQAFLLTLEAPKFPFPIDRELAGAGEKVFAKTCVQCHGTYGPGGSYPNKVVPIDTIGTDRTRFEGFTRRLDEFYHKSWFGQEPGIVYKVADPVGYQAPPLDGVWATAPYFHNGSVPTLEDVLNSKARPRIYTRSFRTDEKAYDPVKVGWRVQLLDKADEKRLSPYQSRKIYDSTQIGRGNGGHTFGDDLSAEQRLAVIEYLKTL